MTDDPAGYRENHKRAIYIAGEINKELLHKLAPQINELRCTSCEPITVYIDSVGGDIEVQRDCVASLLRQRQRARAAVW